MSLIKSIWQIKKEREKKRQSIAPPQPLDTELSEEIKSFRKKKAEFETTNDRETYVVLIFSCNKDKDDFLRFLHYKKETFIDGYDFARKIKAEPVQPSVKLRKPLHQKSGGK